MKPLFVIKMLFFVTALHFTSFIEIPAGPGPKMGVIENEKNPFKGAWEFKIVNGKQGYSNGVLFVGKNNEGYNVNMKIKNGNLTGYDILVTGDKISFNVNYDGLKRVSFILKLDDGQLKGEAYSQKGQTNLVVAKRKFPLK